MRSPSPLATLRLKEIDIFAGTLLVAAYPKGGSRFFRKRGGGGPKNLGGSGKLLEILIANGAFLINLDHQLRAEISPIFSKYFS